jgi:PAS domain S-box-containing protein
VHPAIDKSNRDLETDIGLHPDLDAREPLPHTREVLGRIRASIDRERLRHLRADWWAALVNCLQEGFFLMTTDGMVLEINDAFVRILGYGPEGLPYPPPFPWWPHHDEPEALKAAIDALANRLGQEQGSITLPLRHRDGHQVWAAMTYSAVWDADAGRHLVVGTMRDVTDQHRAGEREAALSRLTSRLSTVDSQREVIMATLAELRDLWQARRSLAVIWDCADEITLNCALPEAGEEAVPSSMYEAMRLRRDGPAHLTIVTRPAPRETSPGTVTGIGTTLEYADGVLSIWLDLPRARHFASEDRALLGLICASLSQALNRAAQSDQQRSVALALQRSILGPAVPSPHFAVRYEPAVRPLEVGGDWYDVVELPRGRIGIVVGDCVGRGLPAAAIMGQLRSACRALLLQAAGPSAVLTALDRFASLIPEALCTTVFCGILDPAKGSVRYSSCGHPPPIVVHHDGTSTLLDGARSTPLAVPATTLRPEATARLRRGSTLLLYTDGLVERPEQSVLAGIAQAAEVMVTARQAPVEALADALMHRLMPEGGYGDDVAVLLYRRP